MEKMEQMEFYQSRYQRIFSRVYETIIQLISMLALSFIVATIFPDKPFLWSVVLLPIGYEVFFFTLMWFAHPKPLRSIIVNDDGFISKHIENTTEVSWDEFEGYRIQGIFIHTIEIKIRERVPLEFGFYAFSGAQRRQLFAIFDEKLQQKMNHSQDNNKD